MDKKINENKYYYGVIRPDGGLCYRLIDLVWYPVCFKKKEKAEKWIVGSKCGYKIKKFQILSV